MLIFFIKATKFSLTKPGLHCEYTRKRLMKLSRFSTATPKFWERYFPHRFYFDEFTQEEIEKMIAEHEGDDSLIPYFYLYLFDKQKYKEERDKLLEICDKIPNAKNRYIKAIIEN